MTIPSSYGGAGRRQAPGGECRIGTEEGGAGTEIELVAGTTVEVHNSARCRTPAALMAAVTPVQASRPGHPSHETPRETMSDAADPIAQRALAINLDRQIYGTFAEIGAGQEVARWFFSVGGAAGTVAKSMSAYDMQVSDAI
jgi:hypothetical protein